MLIQIILLVAIAVIAVMLTRSTAGARHQAVRRLLLAGFVVLAVFSVLFPNWLTVLARFLGVGRGADLLLYALVIAFLSSLATTYRTTGLLNRRITVLARKVALAEAALAAQEARSERQETFDVGGERGDGATLATGSLEEGADVNISGRAASDTTDHTSPRGHVTTPNPVGRPAAGRVVTSDTPLPDSSSH